MPGYKPHVLVSLLLGSATAHAGGFEFPANGTEALGRGGAFTAKADSPLALEYNVAGLAQQRGTRLLFDNNLIFSTYEFQRCTIDPQSGQCVTSPDLPLVSDQAQRPFYAPWFGVTTDFGYFDRFTFAIGAHGPSSVGRRFYPVGREDMGGAARYDVVRTDLLVIMPTLAVAVRPSRYFDMGLSLGGAVGRFNLESFNCPSSRECIKGDAYQDIDRRTQISVTSSFNPILQIGFLLHPSRAVDIGFHVRSGSNLGIRPVEARGTLTASEYNREDPETPGTVLGRSEDAVFATDLPWIFRFGARYAYRKDGREIVDFEANGTYEVWSLAQGEGSRLSATHPVLKESVPKLDVLLLHRYKDTFSFRVGTSYNQPAGPTHLVLRLGLFFDSSATDPAYTRMDFDTLHKLGATIGAGISYRGLTLNLAYAFVHSFSRTVNNGALIALDGLTGKPVSDPDPQEPLETPPAINNGTYSGRNHILSLGLICQFDELVKGERWQRRPPPR